MTFACFQMGVNLFSTQELFRIFITDKERIIEYSLRAQGRKSSCPLDFQGSSELRKFEVALLLRSMNCSG